MGLVADKAWACLRSSGDRIAAELVLHDETRGDVEQCYHRSDMLYERRGSAWDAYCAGRVTFATDTALVLPLRHAIAA